MRRTILLVTLLALAFVLFGHMARADEASEVEVRFTLEGRLGSRTVVRDGDRHALYVVEVGDATYEIDSAGVETVALRRAKGKYVVIRTRAGQPVAEGERGVALTGTVDVRVQEAAPMAGTVRVVQKGKKTAYVLEADDGTWLVEARDARHFKPLVDQYVEAVCFRVSDGRHRALAKVKRVVRKLRDGDRDPRTGEEAIGAAWTGTLTAVEVPKGVPGVKPGDFPVAFRSDRRLEETKGRLMRTYDVVGLRSRKFNRKKRTATIEIAYSFGAGSHALVLEGKFGTDWKTFEGKWKTGFLGSGTFVIALDERASERGEQPR